MVLMVNKTNLVECRAVKNFLDTISSKDAKSRYKNYLNEDLIWLNVKPNEYIKSKRDFAIDYIKFEENIKKIDPNSKTIKLKLLGLRKFLKYYDIPYRIVDCSTVKDFLDSYT